MRKMVVSGRMALITVFLVVLSACSSKSQLEIAESFATQRAEMLEKIMPVEFNGYNLLRSKAKGPEIELTLLYTGNSTISPLQLAESLKETYCHDNEIRSLLEKGVMYKLLFRDSRGRPVLERVIAINDCLSKVGP